MFFPFSQPETFKTDAFSELLRDYGPIAYRMAYQLTGGREAEAHDLVQEVFIRIWRRGPDQRPHSMKGWIYRVMHNLYLDAARHRMRYPSIPLQISNGETYDLEETLADGKPALDASLESQDIQRHVARALTQIDPEFREPVVLCDMEGLAYDDIAEILNCPVGTVRSRIHRGRLQLRRLLVALSVVAAVGGWLFLHINKTKHPQLPPNLEAHTPPHEKVAFHRSPDLPSCRDTQ